MNYESDAISVFGYAWLELHLMPIDRIQRIEVAEETRSVKVFVRPSGPKVIHDEDDELMVVEEGDPLYPTKLDEFVIHDLDNPYPEDYEDDEDDEDDEDNLPA